MRVILVYFPGCPHVAQARANLADALTRSHLVAAWEEVDRDAADTPSAMKRWPSPTVLIDDVPVGGHDGRSAGAACAVGGAPAVESIMQAIAARPRQA